MRKKILIPAILFIFLGGFLFFTNSVFAQGNYGLNDIAQKSGLDKGGDLPTLSGQLLGAVLSFVGVIFLLLMIYGGLLWMTARGNSQQTDKALNVLVSATIGLIIVLGSYVFVTFVFKATGSGTGSAGSCANPIPGLSAGITCTTDADCTSVNSGLRCSVQQTGTRVCQAISDTLCPTQCGSEFSCMTEAQCGSGVTRFHCSGGNEIVCCKPNQQ